MTEPVLKMVVEGPSDAGLIRAILGRELAEQVRFFIAQGRISTTSLGRNILVHEGGPLLVVQDADTTNPQLVDEQRGFVRLALSRFGADGSFDAFFFVPEIEVVFFEAPLALRDCLHRDVSPDILHEGLARPKATLNALRNGKGTKTNDAFTPPDSHVGELLGAGKQASAFKETVQHLLIQHASA
jgi:hypothetical protein